MKIGILTFHMALNYGAFWQAYALNKYIEEELGMDCYLIHYESKYTFIQHIIKRIFSLNPLISVYSILSVYSFKKGWKRMKKTRFTLKVQDAISNEFNAYILGSDEIWNHKNNFVKPLDYTYFGEHFEAEKIITYSPTFGTVNSNEALPKEIVESIRRLNFSNISVRDKNSQIIIEKMINKKVPILVDPVFLYKLPTELEKVSCKYILVYGNHLSENFIKAIKIIAKRENAKIYSFGYYNGFADKNLLFKSPMDIMKYFNSALYVFTNMYHGVVFSLHCRKQFWMQYNVSKQNKIVTLLLNIGMSDRIVKDIDEVESSYEYIKLHPEAYEQGIKLLENLVEESKDFIKNRLITMQNVICKKIV